MAIFKRKTETGEVWVYRLTVRFPDGRKQRIFGTPPNNTKVAAEMAMQRHVDRLLHPPVTPTAPIVEESPTFGAFATEWLKIYSASAGNRASTAAAHEGHCRVHLIPLLGETRLNQIDSRAIARVFVTLSETPNGTVTKAAAKPLSSTTIRNIGATLHKILICALQWGKLPQGIPVWPKRKVVHASWDFYTAQESRLLLEAAQRQDYQTRAALLFALRTGARAGEQLALEWGDLDFTNHQVCFRRSLHNGVEGPTKTGHERVVPLSPELETVLKCLPQPGKKVFCRADGSPWTLTSFARRLEDVRRHAGLRRIRWHDLRHSFASQCMIAGVQIKQVQEWLGHSTITMTMRYAHLAPNEDKVKLVALLEAS
jgi:integrase